MGVDVVIQTLGDKFQDYREEIAGDSFNFGPVIQADKVKYFCFHHSVTPQTAKTDGNWKAECDYIAKEHLERRQEGYTGVGYRFIICSDGTVAYVGDLSHGGAAVRYHNDEIISACLVGDFTKEVPTDAQIDSAHKLADWFINNMPQYPLIDSWDKIIGHKDAAVIYHQPAIATACPGLGWGGLNAPNNELKWRIETDTRYTPQPSVQSPDTIAELEQLRKENDELKIQLQQLRDENANKLKGFVSAIVEAAQKAQIQ